MKIAIIICCAVFILFSIIKSKQFWDLYNNKDVRQKFISNYLRTPESIDDFVSSLGHMLFMCSMVLIVVYIMIVILIAIS